MAKKRKLSDFSYSETSSILKVLTNIKDDLDEEDAEESEFIKNLDKVLDKLQETLCFSDAIVLSFANMHISMGPLILINDKADEIHTLGQKLGSGGLTIEETKNIGLIRNHVSFETVAGCRLIINAILVHAASNLGSSESESAIIIAPESSSAYSGAVDYMMVSSPKSLKEYVLRSPKFAFTTPKIAQQLSSNIYEAKNVNLHNAVPQAAMAAVDECQRHGFQTLRGCVSNGEERTFFVYNKSPSDGSVSVLRNIHLKEDMSGFNHWLAI